METAETQAESPGQASGPPPLPTGKPWGFWATLGLALVNLTCAAASMLAVMLAFILFAWFADDDTSFPEAVQAFVSNPIAGWVGVVPGAGVGLGVLVLFVRARKTLGVAEYLALHPVSPHKFFAWLALAGGALMCLQIGTTLLTEGVGVETVPSIFRYYPPLLAGAVMVAGAYGEVLIWGFLYRGFSESVLGQSGTVLLIAIATGCFTALTGQPVRVIASVLCMALVGWTRIGTGSVYMPVAIHVLGRIVSITVQIVLTVPEE